MSVNIDTVNAIREFNRFYTNILGLLDRHILSSDYSLTEARILFELNETGCCMANVLSAKLDVDKSYLSRITGRFEKEGLISKKTAHQDNRANYIRITERGSRVIHDLIDKSNHQIIQLINSLSDEECVKVQAAMGTVKKYLTKAGMAMTIRPFTHNDVDFIISRQISLYKKEYGFTSEIWKAYVADGVRQLTDNFDLEKDCVYILEANGSLSGCIAIAHADDVTAQLRFFFVESALRGLGAGRRLIDMAISFCREKEYRQVFLWTFSRLEAARHLYGQKGFQMTETHENSDWGETVLEEQWRLDL
jgi:Transcriptional regulators